MKLGKIPQAELRELARLREIRQKKTLLMLNGLLVTEKDARDYRENFCSSCGKFKKDPKLWFGESFCGDCVERFKAGK